MLLLAPGNSVRISSGFSTKPTEPANTAQSEAAPPDRNDRQSLAPGIEPPPTSRTAGSCSCR
eukprot:5229774-Prymnesium_polylepis.1